MNYLYGDSTASKLKSNFLEFLRDAIDFSVFVLQADARMKEGRKRIRILTEESEAELARLERFISSVQRAVHNGEKGESGSPTAQCGQRLASLIADAHRASIEGVRRVLAEDIARIEADEAADRAACVRALGTLLAPHEPPDAVTTLRLGLLDSGRYDATLEGNAEPALAWTLEVAIPDGHAWATPMRLDRLVPHLEIRAPQLGGWITKEVRIRPQKLERHVVTGLVDRADELTIELRTEATSGVGFDLHVNPESNQVRAERIGPAEDASNGPFDPNADDVPALVELTKKLRASLNGLERRPNITATFDATDFQALPGYVEVVERLVAMMAPIVREIAQRSLTPNELILRRQLTNDRREEIFVAKATLREKLAVLPTASKEIFASLGLDIAGTAPKVTPEIAAEKPTIRSELPPAPPPGAIKIQSYPPTEETPPSSRTLQPPRGVAPQANPPSDDAPQIEVVDEDVPSDAFDALPDSTRKAPDSVRRPPDSSRKPRKIDPANESLVTALKKISTLSRNGRAAEAYQEYAELFSSSDFSAYRPEDQRQALKLMVLASKHPAEKDVVGAAHRAALERIRALVELAHEPADQELLGVTLLYLGDDKAATAAFQAGLEGERAKNPQSDLALSLLRRVGQ